MRQTNTIKNQIISALLLLFCGASVPLSAQVTGISYTISPVAEYNWWDEKSGLDDGFMVGGKLGIGFGEFVELRGLYMRSTNQKTNFDDYGLLNFDKDLFEARDIDIVRYGAELRANLGSGKFLPYLTLGSGIQTIDGDNFTKNETIYISGGLGFKFSINDRYTFNIEAKNTPYNFNATRNLLTLEERIQYNLSEGELFSEQLKKNWSLGASFQIYLGGRRPGELTDLDKAYMSTFSSGLRGLSIPIEPTLAYVNFNSNLGFRDAWMLGGYIGLDFNQYVGIRGFYFRAMEDDKVTTDFDALNMYGGELRLKVSAGRGINPYLILGGGYIDVKNKYVPNRFRVAEDQGFASGGVGISVPVSKRFNLFGSARVLLTAGEEFQELEVTNEIKRSFMYGAGLRFIIGKKANPQAVLKTTIDQRVNAALAIQEKKNTVKSEELTQKYEARLVDLETELNMAYEAEDIEKAAALMAEKEENEKVVAELKSRASAKEAQMEKDLASKEANLDSLEKNYKKQIVELEGDLNAAYDKRDMDASAKLRTEKEDAQKKLADVEVAKQNREGEAGNSTALVVKGSGANNSNGNQPQGSVTIVPSTSRLQMTPAEFENLIEEVLENMIMPGDPNAYYPTTNLQKKANQSDQLTTDKRIENIENLLIQMNESQGKVQAKTEEMGPKQATTITTGAATDSVKISSNREMTEYSAKLLMEIQKLNDKIDANNKEIQNLKAKTQTKKEAKKAKKDMEQEMKKEVKEEVKEDMKKQKDEAVEEVKEMTKKEKKKMEKAAKKAAKEEGGN